MNFITQMITQQVAGYAALRLQLLCLRRLEQADGASGSQLLLLPLEVEEKWLPLLERLQGRTADLLQGWATTARLWRLAGRREPAAGPAARDQRGKRNGKPINGTNGHAGFDPGD